MAAAMVEGMTGLAKDDLADFPLFAEVLDQLGSRGRDGFLSAAFRELLPDRPAREIAGLTSVASALLDGDLRPSTVSWKLAKGQIKEALPPELQAWRHAPDLVDLLWRMHQLRSSRGR